MRVPSPCHAKRRSAALLTVLVLAAALVPALAARADLPLAGTFTPVAATHVLDTGTGLGAPTGPVGPGNVIRLRVTGLGSVPNAGVGAVVIVLTARQSQGGGHLTVYADGSDAPGVSNLNYAAGRDVTNSVTASVGPSGVVDILNGPGGASVQIAADIVGWFAAGPATLAGAFQPIAPRRILDTRIGLGAAAQTIPSRADLRLPVLGVAGIPASGVSALSLNLTVTGAESWGHIVAFSGGVDPPTSSNLNFEANQDTANAAIVTVGADGTIDLYNGSDGRIHLVVDVNGFYLAGTASEPGTFVAVPATRLIDTRTGTGRSCACAIAAGDSVTVTPNGAGGAVAAVMNLTVTRTTNSGYMVPYAAGSDIRTATGVAYSANHDLAGLVTTGTGIANGVTLLNRSAGSADLVADLEGYYRGRSSATPLFRYGSTTRPFASDSPWNTPIPGAAPLDPNSAAIASHVLDDPRLVLNLNLYAYGVPFYTATATTPRIHIGGPNNGVSDSIPMDPSWRPNEGADHKLNIWDPAGGVVFEINGYDPSTHQAAWLTAHNYVSGLGDGEPSAGEPTSPTGSAVSQAGGVIRIADIESGNIDHALSFVTSNPTAGEYRYPASKTDGSYTGTDGIQEGMRIQLDPSVNVDAIQDITPGEAMIAKALQKYGAYCVDNSGGSNQAMGFYAESPAAGTADPYPAAGFAHDWMSLPHIPRDKLHILAASVTRRPR